MKSLFVTLIAGANVCTILILWAVCASSWLSPVLYPRIAQAGLLMPIALGANIAFVLLWLLIDLKGLLLPILGMAPVYGFCLDYYPLNLSLHKPVSDSVETLRVATFNCDGWKVKDSTDGQWNAPQLLHEMNADILCLQECFKVPKDMEGTLQELGYTYQKNQNAVICSRHPFVGDSIPIGRTGSKNSALACRVQVGGDTVTVIDVHLECTHIPQGERIALGEHLHTHNRDSIEKSGRLILGFLSESAGTRARQVNKVDSLIAAHEGENIILCGDFNDTPISNSYQKIGKRLTNCFRESGRGAGWTYVLPGFWVRIDHIFVSSQWESHDTHVVRKYRASDHYPILTTLTRRLQ